MSVIQEFKFSIRDFAVAETHVDFIAREVQSAVDNTVEELAKMDITVESVKIPALQVSKQINEFSEVFRGEMNRVKDALEGKKQEFIKTNEDYSAYDEAKKQATELAGSDLKTITSQAKKARIIG